MQFPAEVSTVISNFIGLLVGAKLYFPFNDSLHSDKVYTNLAKEIGERGKMVSTILIVQPLHKSFDFFFKIDRIRKKIQKINERPHKLHRMSVTIAYQITMTDIRCNS